MRYCLRLSHSGRARSAAITVVLLMIPGIGVKTDCKRGFALGD